MLRELGQDIRHAARQFVRDRGFAAIVVIMLAVGVGGSAAMFSAVDAALLRPLPFERPDRLVALPGVDVPASFAGEPEEGEGRWLNIVDVRAMSHLFESVSAYAVGGLNLADPDRPLRVQVGVVTAGFLKTLGVSPLVGRTFAAEEGEPDAPRVAILSYGLWQRQFGGGAIDGLSITLNADRYTVVGVMKPGFTFPGEMIWVAACALGVGLAGAWAGARLLASMLYGVAAHDTATFVGAPLVLFLLVILGALAPARRVLRLDPLDVMRIE